MMSESGNGVGSWPGFLAQVNNTFNLLRDIFGYAMPGGVFIATGLVSKRFSLSDIDDLLSPYHPPTWAFVILVVGACYIIGHIMAATAYLPISFAQWMIWEGSRIRRGIKRWVQGWGAGSAREKLKSVDRKLVSWLKPWLEPWLKESPNEVSVPVLKARWRHEKLLAALDRRETLTILAGSTSVALLGGWWIFFHEQWDASTILRWTGLLLLVDFSIGMSRLRRAAAAIVEADKELNDEEANDKR